MSLVPCLTYVTGSSATPSSSCCSQLGNVVSSNPRCLCTLLNGGGSSLGVSINQTLALTLPDQCKVQTPPVSQCNNSVAEGPAGGPSKATSPVPVGSPIANAPKTATTVTIPPISSGKNNTLSCFS
ncbi:hypothetical protein Leryth_018129 [Lithospermum erythrorhizon]|uniref:Bifunctional inhibitor/plant lipid transfer protein/seed storage helical domain-containing protein n=1 Tax=Lithospermum erythrorhizon TaxID=34254 RepID=A0AAV3RI34_LITER|nr:hypothetical protein Leryth_018129 [Lithospermum erythrorhizon]